MYIYNILYNYVFFILFCFISVNYIILLKNYSKKMP